MGYHKTRAGGTAKRKVRRSALIASVALLGTFYTGVAANAADWNTIANSATEIPGGGGVLFSSFGQPSLNDACDIVFRARGKGPNEPVRGIYNGDACKAGSALGKVVAAKDMVPQPNNLESDFTEFPAFPRIDIRSSLVATRGQSEPVWEFTLPDGTDTRVGTSGVYAGLLGSPVITGASQLGAVPGFEYFDVPRFDGVKFDQFPGAPVPFGGSKIAFKGNFTSLKGVSRTGVYVRDIFDAGGEATVKRVADSTMKIPGQDVKFGSTAPPSAADTSVVFTGLDNEEKPKLGGIYRSVAPFNALETLVQIGDPVPAAGAATFNKFGEGLSYDGKNMAFWGAWGTDTRRVKLHCPADGNADIIAECQVQCPRVDEIGNYCVKSVPVNQGIFVRRPDGSIRKIAQSGPDSTYKDFLFWVFSGRPPGTADSESEDFEGPRWRSSAFVAVTARGTGIATAFKAKKQDNEVGIYSRVGLDPIQPVVVVGQDAATIDPAAPAGAAVSAVGLERDGFRNCVLAINASFLNATTSESWAGVYATPSYCATATKE